MKKFDVEGKINNKSKIDLFDFFCSRHGETPNNEQIDYFIHICNQFFNTNPEHIIGIIFFVFVKFFVLKINFID